MGDDDIKIFIQLLCSTIVIVYYECGLMWFISKDLSVIKYCVATSSFSNWISNLLFFLFIYAILVGGMLPKSQASPKMVEIYVAQQRDKRRKLLQKYIDACLASKVNLFMCM